MGIGGKGTLKFSARLCVFIPIPHKTQLSRYLCFRDKKTEGQKGQVV